MLQSCEQCLDCHSTLKICSCSVSLLACNMEQLVRVFFSALGCSCQASRSLPSEPKHQQGGTGNSEISKGIHCESPSSRHCNPSISALTCIVKDALLLLATSDETYIRRHYEAPILHVATCEGDQIKQVDDSTSLLMRYWIEA